MNTNTPEKTGTPYFLLKSTQKTFYILEILCKEGETSLSELAKRTNLQKSNIHRLLATLEYLGYVEQNPSTYKYFPSLKTFEIGNAVISRTGLLPITHPFLEELGRHFGETNNLGVLDRGDVIYVDKVESSESLRMDSKVGTRVPAYCTALGKVLIANLGESDLTKYLDSHPLIPLTKRTITSPEKLRQVLKQIRSLNCAIDDEEFSNGTRCIASSLRDYSGRIIAAISIAGPSIRMNLKRIAELKVPLLAAAKGISRKLGYFHRDL